LLIYYTFTSLEKITCISTLSISPFNKQTSPKKLLSTCFFLDVQKRRIDKRILPKEVRNNSLSARGRPGGGSGGRLANTVHWLIPGRFEINQSKGLYYLMRV